MNPIADPFEDLIEQMASDPMFIQQCEENNRRRDEEVAALKAKTLEELS